MSGQQQRRDQPLTGRGEVAGHISPGEHRRGRFTTRDTPQEGSDPHSTVGNEHRRGDREGQVFISRGTGYWGPPMRLGNAPEIARIVLVS